MNDDNIVIYWSGVKWEQKDKRHSRNEISHGADQFYPLPKSLTPL
jgi:hypothetical protein